MGVEVGGVGGLKEQPERMGGPQNTENTGGGVGAGAGAGYALPLGCNTPEEFHIFTHLKNVGDLRQGDEGHHPLTV